MGPIEESHTDCDHLESGLSTLVLRLEICIGPSALAGDILGILVLILTPTLRVLLTLLLFVVAHDWTFVLITCIVLAVLVLGLLGLTGKIRCHVRKPRMPSPSSPVAVSIGNLAIRWYALFLVLGMIAGVALIRWVGTLTAQSLRRV